MFTKDTHCRICGSNWYDDTNNEGWWCANCDGYNYWNLAAHDNHKFTVILEDKLQKKLLLEEKVSTKSSFLLYVILEVKVS